tara:strand:- start:638 stop:979 length:342 start_codon:yes stop_codon:yes gene_type:complete
MKLKTIAYRIVEADVKKRRLLRKVEDVFGCEPLLEDSMAELVWEMLGIKKHTTIGVYNKIINASELLEEYYGDEHLTEMYYGCGGVIDGGTTISEYIDEILRLKEMMESEKKE